MDEKTVALCILCDHIPIVHGRAPEDPLGCACCARVGSVAVRFVPYATIDPPVSYLTGPACFARSGEPPADGTIRA